MQVIENQDQTLVLNPAHVVRVTLDAPIDVTGHQHYDHMSEDERDRLSSWRVTAHTLELRGVASNQGYEVFRSKNEADARWHFDLVTGLIYQWRQG